MTRLDCGHDVEVAVGTRLWCYYDATFGVVREVGTEPDPWHDFVCDGSPYKGVNSPGYYNAQRLACQRCGEDHVARSGDLEFVPGTFTLRDAKAVS